MKNLVRNHFTKIVATLGPASSSPEVIKKLVRAGANIFRLNFSHGNHDIHKQNVEYIRAIEQELEIPLAILCDLQGPKLRIGTFENNEALLHTGQEFRLDMSPEPGNEKRVCLPHPEIFHAMEDGMDLLLNDGLVHLRVKEFDEDHALTEVITGGLLSNKKGVNVPSVPLPISSLTEKDKADLEVALQMGVDLIGLSFVQRPEDILMARELIKNKAWIVSKIEKPAALSCLDEIVRLSDAIMVARGDLGVETPPEKVPILQKRIVASCRKAGKPVIVATQMLESMVKNPTPTRAEASDVATAVFDGVDAVMLSAETAAGTYPVEAVSLMRRIIEQVEADELYTKMMDASRLPSDPTTEGAINASARLTAQLVKEARAIVSYTMSGGTTLRAAKERPCMSILSITPDRRAARRLTLVWGVRSIVSDTITDFPDIETRAHKFALYFNLAEPGDKLIITVGIPFNKTGTTNILYISSIPGEKAE